MLVHFDLLSWTAGVAVAVAVAAASNLRAPQGMQDGGQCSAVDTPHPQLRCRFQGELADGHAFNTSSHLNFPLCRDSCLGRAHCKAFSFAPADGAEPELSADGVCALYHRRLSKQAPQADNTSTTYFWNRRCFTTVPYLSDPVVNGGFETGRFAPWTATKFVNDSSAAGHRVVSDNNNGGLYAAQLHLQCGNGSCDDPSSLNYVGISQAVFLCEGVGYTFTYSIFIEPSQLSSNFALDVFLLQPAINGLFTPESSADYPLGSTPNGQWIGSTYSFTASRSGYWVAFFLLGALGDGTGTVRVDDVKIHAL